MFLVALLAGVWGCGGDADPHAVASGARVVVDDAGHTVRVARPAHRVVSLLPAAAETMYSLGAGDRLVGRTRYDLDPRLDGVPSVGGGLDPNLEILISVRPDLVIGFETAGGSPLRARLETLGIPFLGIRTQDTTDIFHTIERIGALLALESEADSLADAIRAELAEVEQLARSRVPDARPTVVYLADRDPPIIAGAGTYLMEMAEVAGGDPIPAAREARGSWPQISLETLVREDPDLILLPVRGDTAGAVERLQNQAGWREIPAVREGRIVTIDADLASRPGPGIGLLARELFRAISSRPIGS